MIKIISKLRLIGLFLIFGLIVVCISTATAKFPDAPDVIEAGKKIYGRHCWPCHGVEGAGDGPAAAILEPRPRNFVAALFKLRTTSTGSLPLDEDMLKTITNGMPGSAMPSFAKLLSETERKQVISYIKTFADYFTDSELDPYKFTVKIGTPPQATPDNIQKGRDAYQKAECFKCHGDKGRGNGESAKELTDQEGYRILPRNLTKGWKYRGGTSVTDIYTRFTTGMDGTPMPSFIDNLSDDERWNLSLYVKSLIQERNLAASMLKAKYVEGDLPMDSSDPLWDQAEPLLVALAGQIIWKPRWLIPSVDTMTIKALFNDNDIVFNLRYDDRFKDVVHDEASLEPPTDTAYPILESEDPEFDPHYMLLANDFVLRDSVAIQFPVKLEEGIEKPHFMWGYANKPVYLLKYNADWQEDSNKKTCIDEMNAKGHKNPPASQPEENQAATGSGVWDDGQWSVIIKRSLFTEDKNDIQFEKGKFIPVSFQAWDGSNSEEGSRMSLSTWNYLVLEAGTPVSVYIYTGIFIIIAYLFEWFFTWKARKKKKENSFLNFDFSNKGY
ncbi:MAG: c-type cytochrome [Candidatus Anammoxibacter sp.]